MLSGRLASLCGQSQAALENSLKALVHLRGLESPGRIHKLEQLLPKLSADMRKDVDTLLADIALEDASLWRPRDTCPADFPEIPLAEHAPLAFRMLTAAAALTGYTADRIAPAAADGAPEPAPPSGTAARPAATERTANLARQAATGVALALTGWDIDANNPTAIMGCPPLPEPPDAAH